MGPRRSRRAIREASIEAGMVIWGDASTVAASAVMVSKTALVISSTKSGTPSARATMASKM
jgi:hypothetical protein